MNPLTILIILIVVNVFLFVSSFLKDNNYFRMKENWKQLLQKRMR